MRKFPYSPNMDEILAFVSNGLIITLFKDQVMTDVFGENTYMKVRLESGKEGYVLKEALEMIQ